MNPASETGTGPELAALEERYRRLLVEQFGRLTFKGISRSGKAVSLPLENAGRSASQRSQSLINDHDSTINRRAIATAMAALDYATETWYALPHTGGSVRTKAAEILGALEPIYRSDEVFTRLTRVLGEDGSGEARDAAYQALLRLAVVPEAGHDLESFLTSPSNPEQCRAAPQSTTPAMPPLPPSFVLHLSDLHFGTAENAATWYSQLAEDLQTELACSRLDALILSGDIANRSILVIHPPDAPGRGPQRDPPSGHLAESAAQGDAGGDGGRAGRSWRRDEHGDAEAAEALPRSHAALRPLSRSTSANRGHRFHGLPVHGAAVRGQPEGRGAIEQRPTKPNRRRGPARATAMVRATALPGRARIVSCGPRGLRLSDRSS
jgi:hypothetical protein